ncbi:PP2C family protein-serine/threonine phosphatase [Streptomyces lydicus]|uniref:PP2C family protein-serine/threonine phosphatase n=1 Tax=Streptomyces lydicus TaxID=47763 RepID=UPI0036FBDA30
MTPHTYHRTFHSLPTLRTAVRSLGDTHQLAIETRARLVLSVAALADRAFRAGRPVTLEAVCDTGTGPGDPLLSVTLRTKGPLPPAELPLPAETAPDGTAATWCLPLAAPDAPAPYDQAAAPDAPTPHDGAGPARPAPATTATAQNNGHAEGLVTAPTETHALEEELRAALAQVDALSEAHRQLKHELAETNSGVLALYVQLEERDEQLRTAHGQVLRELEDALRPPPIAVDGLELAVHYAPAETDAPTGGDLYDWFSLPDGTVHITLVDALGHGVRSTRSALNVTHAVRTLALEGHLLGSIVRRTNEILAPFDPDVMATVILLRIDPGTGHLELANGSHPPALMMRHDGSAQYLEVRGRGIGYPLPGSDRVLAEKLEPGDLLVLYTDGLTESRRDPLEGEARLIESARRHRQRPIEDVPGAIAGDMHTVVLHPDDTVALTVRRTPARLAEESR